MDVLAVNSAPVIYLPSYLEAVEDAPMNINGVYITDSDIQHTSGSMMTVNVTVENGSVSFWNRVLSRTVSEAHSMNHKLYLYNNTSSNGYS